ncbi:MAG: hypothetical protein LBT50_09220 [Prevotellaceae bacterium]|jgi:hypothetical protein|nr:hypothetical protein [Prevotellaceae bacterium]
MKKINLKSEVWNGIGVIVSVLAVIIAIASFFYTCSNDKKQTESSNREKEIQQILAEADTEFGHKHFEDALKLYVKADSLGSTDKRGYRKFMNKADEQESKSGKCNEFTIDYLKCAKKLQETEEVNNRLNECNPNRK